MAGGGIEVPIDGDITPLLATFAELPGRTQEEMRAVGKIIQDEATKGQIYKGFLAIEGVSEKSAKRATAAVLKEMQAAAKEAERTTAAAAKAAEEATKDVKKAATVMFGGVIGDIEDLMSMLASIGPAGAAGITAFGAALTASAVVASIIELERAAGEAVKRLDELGMPVDPVLRDSIEQANAQMDAFYVVMDQVVVQLAASLGPSVAEAATQIGAFAIEFADLVEETLKTQTAIEYFTTYLGSTFIQGVLTPVTAVAQLTEGLGYLGETLGFQNNAVKKLGQSYDDWTWSLAQGNQATNNFVELAAGGMPVLEDFNGVLLTSQDRFSMTADATRRAREEKDKHTKATQAHTEAVKAEKKVKDELAIWEEQYAYEQGKNAANWIAQQEALNRANEAPALEQERKLAWLAEYDKQAAQLAADDEERSRAGFEAEIARVHELQRARAQATQEYLFAGIAAAATLAQAVADSAEEGSAAQQAAAIAAFRLNQAGSIGTIAINTAEAITKGIALFGPPPAPAGIAAITFASAIGLAQAAAVAAQAPPTFHAGGVIASNPLSPDETMVVARKGEEIRTRQQQGGGANVTVQMVYQHRIFDSFVMDNMRQAGSPLRREIHKASGRRVGHRG